VLQEPELQSEGAALSSRPKQATLRRNVTTNYLVAVSVAAVGFLTTPVLTHQLGIVRYGVWALVGSLIPFLELLELGFAAATVAFVSRHLELEENDKVAATLNTSFLCLSALGILAFAGVVVFAVYLPDLVTSIPKAYVGQAQFLILLLAFDMALSIPMDTYGGALAALQRFDLLNYSLIVVMLGQAIAWVVVLWLHGGLIALGVVTVVISLAGQVARMVIVHRLIPWFHLSLRRFDRALLRAFTAASGWFSLLQISDAVLSLSDILIVGAAAGVRDAAVYAVAQRLGLLPIRIVQPRTSLLFTKSGQLTARGNREGVRESTDDVVRYVQYLCVPAAVALGFLAGPTIEAWVGPQFSEAAAVVGLLCAASVIQSWALTIRNAINGSGRPQLAAIVFAIEAVIHVTLGIFLTSRYGAVGMAEAVLIGIVVMEGTLMIPLGYRALDDSVIGRAWRSVRTLGPPTVVTSALAWGLGRGGGPLYAFVDTHGRILGLTAVALAGIALVVVFYAVLFVCIPPFQRQQVLARSRIWLGRFAARPHQGSDA
jgi:O-antigen/teichoic acid export membrane protein